MTIETKFNLGDTVYALSSDYRVMTGQVTGCNVYVYEDGHMNIYCEVRNMERDSYLEPVLFASKEEIYKRVTEEKWEPKEK